MKCAILALLLGVMAYVATDEVLASTTVFFAVEFADQWLIARNRTRALLRTKDALSKLDEALKAHGHKQS